MEQNTNEKQIPLIVAVENVNAKINSVILEARENGVPSYIIEGILTGALADLRAASKNELFSLYVSATMSDEESKEE